MKKYEVIEDNGGGLALYIFGENGAVEYIHSGYECTPGQLTQDLQALKEGDDPAEEWDGNFDYESVELNSLQEVYEHDTSYEYGWAVVADNDGVYPDKMGRAAQIEFGC